MSRFTTARKDKSPTFCKKFFSRMVGSIFISYVVWVTYIAFRKVAAPVVRAPYISRTPAVTGSTGIYNPVDVTEAIRDLHYALSKERLQKIAYDYSRTYQQNLPFPHIAIDGIFPDSFLKLVIQELAEPGKDGCVDKSSVCYTVVSQQFKSIIDEEEKMGVYTRMLFEKMKGSTFVQFLEELSGIHNIIADPHYRGSGLHFTAPGGFLDIHADFNKYHKFGLDRRVNAFIYLNENWKEEDGGHLELWSKDMKSCYQRILPAFNRFVAFSSTDFSYHGHPQPLKSTRSRRSLALYYYTNGRPSSECLNQDCSGYGHTTLFQQPQGCERCEDSTCRAYAEDTYQFD